VIQRLQLRTNILQTLSILHPHTYRKHTAVWAVAISFCESCSFNSRNNRIISVSVDPMSVDFLPLMLSHPAVHAERKTHWEPRDVRRRWHRESCLGEFWGKVWGNFGGNLGEGTASHFAVFLGEPWGNFGGNLVGPLAIFDLSGQRFLFSQTRLNALEIDAKTTEIHETMHLFANPLAIALVHTIAVMQWLTTTQRNSNHRGSGCRQRIQRPMPAGPRMVLTATRISARVAGETRHSCREGRTRIEECPRI